MNTALWDLPCHAGFQHSNFQKAILHLLMFKLLCNRPRSKLIPFKQLWQAVGDHAHTAVSQAYMLLPVREITSTRTVCPGLSLLLSTIVFGLRR